MRASFACVAFVAFVVVACGGSKAEENLFGSSGGPGGDGGAGDGGTGGRTDGGPRPTLESLETCSAPGTCELGGTGCCGLTCQPDSQLVAIRRGEAQDLVAATCNQTGPVACPNCARQMDPNVQAFCVSGKCSVVDLRMDSISACTNQQDCVLRYASCCQPCNGGAVSAIVSILAGQESTLSAQLCSGTEKCDQCLPVFPSNVSARCNPTTRHCEVSTR